MYVTLCNGTRSILTHTLFQFNGDPFNTAGSDDDKDGSSESKQQEQAATTAPEGTQEADAQRQGQNTDKTNYMGSN